MEGIIVIDKPQKYTSHDCVAILRRQTGIKKIGHTGTLDPMATGVLPLCVGKATRVAEYLEKGEKKYQATLRLGLETDTGDIWGNLLHEKKLSVDCREEVEKVFQEFLGEIDQIPPMYSAIKVEGRKLYEYARKGKSIRVKPRTVTIHALELQSVKDNEICFSVVCSKGTYIRSLCQDMGRALGTYGTLSSLRRISSGAFSLEQAIDLDTIKSMNKEALEKKMLPMDFGLDHFPAVFLEGEQIRDFFHGKTVETKATPINKLYRVYGSGLFIGMGQCEKQDRIKGKKVFLRERTDENF